MKLQNKLTLAALSMVFVGGFVYAQIYIHHKNRKELKEIASELALNWQHKLGLTQEQTLGLENIIIEYTLRKNAIIDSSAKQEIKVNKLKRVQHKEHKNLQKLMSTPQFEAYLTINKRIPDLVLNAE